MKIKNIILTFFMSIQTFAFIMHTFSADEEISHIKMNDNFANSNKADYNSGWLPVFSSTTNSVKLAHNIGEVPSRITILLSDQQTDNPTRVIHLSKSTLIAMRGTPQRKLQLVKIVY